MQTLATAVCCSGFESTALLSVPITRVKAPSKTPLSTILLIQVRGEDRRGLLTQMTSIVAAKGGVILDAAQSIIHDGLNLGMVVSFESEALGDLIKDLLFQCQELGLTIKFKPLDHQSYEKWVERSQEDRFIITLLSRELGASQMNHACSILLEHGLNVETIRRLSHPQSTDLAEGQRRMCVEMGVRGQPHDLEKLKERFLTIGSQEGIDLAFQKDDIYRRNRRLVVFDMDSTLLKIEVIDELARQMGVVDQVGAITEAAMNGEIDFDESFRRRVRLLKGMKKEVIDNIIADMPLNDGAERLIRALKSVGYKVAILSGGFIYFVEALKKQLGVDYGHANALEFIDGVATGEVLGEIINGDRKLHYMKKIAEGEGIGLKQVIAIGDGANDLPMLTHAGLGVAFRAKALVKASADHSLSTMGLDGVLYLLGFHDEEFRDI